MAPNWSILVIWNFICLEISILYLWKRLGRPLNYLPLDREPHPKHFLLVNFGKPSQVQLGTIQVRPRPQGFITLVSDMLRKVLLLPYLGEEIVRGSVRGESCFFCII